MRLGTTKNWVVIYRDDHQGAGQWTVITSQFGHLSGGRIVRGREAECEALYESESVTGPVVEPQKGQGVVLQP